MLSLGVVMIRKNKLSFQPGEALQGLSKLGPQLCHTGGII